MGSKKKIGEKFTEVENMKFCLKELGGKAGVERKGYGQL